ncbi:transposase [Pseudalkalibacillus sp. A8]|uniref:transposase n=1 Tax=Pseudalkalibacillus sp. A8 TaxID=3382641 RepID=UPI0038B667EE
MSKRSKYSLEDKLEIVMKVNSGDESVLTLSKKLGLSTSDIYKWVHLKRLWRNCGWNIARMKRNHGGSVY